MTAARTRSLAIALAAAAGLLLVFGCTPRQSVDGRRVVRWVVDPNPVREDQIRGFDDTHGRDIRVNLDPDAGRQKVLTQLAGRIYPELFAIYDPATVQVFARKGVLTDLRPYMEKAGISLDDFWPQLAPYMTYNGKVVGLPDNCGTYVVFYNRRLFREAGLPYPRPDWTWDELTHAARKLTVKDRRGRTAQFGIGYIEPWMILWQYGARMYSDDGKRCTINSPEAKAGAKFWASFRLTEHITPLPSEEQGLATMGAWGGAGMLFKAEKIGMHVVGRWMSVEYRKNKDLDWDVAPIPQSGKVKASLLASKAYAIPKGNQNKDAAFTFLKYLMSKRNQLIVASTGDGIPSIRKYAESPEFLHNPDYPNEKNNQVYLDDMQYGRSPEVSPYISELDATAIFNEEMDLMWQRKQTPEDACNRIAERVNAIIRRNIANPNLLD